ncbi:MAG: tetratricopeptide repeat protein, partial [Opitutaceae bacterium]|nr:tetratricopeptide repeat protein [Verrucomicrobiales bacterium]
PQTAVFSLEILVKNSPNDMDAAEQLARVYLSLGQVNKAEELYNQLVAARPNDPNLAQAMKNLAAKRMLVEGGYEALADGTKSYRDILRDKDGAVALEQETRQVKNEEVLLRLIQDNEARLQVEPDNLKLIRSIGDLHLQRKDFDRAVEYYQNILKVSGISDPGVERAISDAMTRKLDLASSQLDPQAPDFAEQKARIKAERDQFVIEECRRRVERYPNDLLIRFELGQHYFNAGKIGEAIQEFQKSQNNPSKKITSQNYLGQCFARRNMNDIAARTFQNALKEKVGFDEEKKEMIYLLGCVLEKMGKKEEAIEQLKQIYEVDIGYKDVAAKVDAYYSAQG